MQISQLLQSPMDSKRGHSLNEPDFALDQILQNDRKFDEFGTPLLKRKSYDSADRSAPLSPLPASDLQQRDFLTTHSHTRFAESTTIQSTSANGSASMRSPLSTFKLMSQTIAEYGDMIAQRRTEIAELQRANNLRLTNSAFPKSTISEKNSNAEHRYISMSEGVSLASVMAGEDQSSETPGRKFQFCGGGHEATADLTGVRLAETPKDVVLQCSEPWSISSLREELLSQLNGEKLRVHELTTKINEMYQLEEEQRIKARDLAETNDRLELARDKLEEKLRTLENQVDKLEEQSEAKDDRIRELERQISEWISSYDECLRDCTQSHTDHASLAEKIEKLTLQLDAEMMKNRLLSDDNSNLQRKLEDVESSGQALLKQKLILQHQRDEMVGKVASLEASVGSFRSEMRLMAQRNEQCSTVIHDKELEIDRLQALLVEAHDRETQLHHDVVILRERAGAVVGYADGSESEQLLVANESRKHLQLKIASLENALSATTNEFHQYKEQVQDELRSKQQLSHSQQIMIAQLEERISSYVTTFNQLQQDQQNEESNVLEENDRLRGIISDLEAKIDSLDKQIALGEQSWVQQVEQLKQVLKESNESKIAAVRKMEAAQAELSLLKTATAVPHAAPVCVSKDQEQQSLASRNELFRQSLTHKWKTAILLFSVWISLLAALCSFAISFKPCTHDDFRVTS